VSPARYGAWCVALGLLASAAPAPARAAAADAADGSLAPTLARSYAAHVVVATDARTAPDAASPVRMRLSTATPWTRGPMTLLVLDARRDARGGRWLRVRLPIRPNDAAGWISEDVVRLQRNPWRVLVSTRRRTVSLLRDGRVVRVARAVVGRPGTPTPHGRFAIYERARQASPLGFVGPWALHLTAHSTVLENYGGGPGRVAIHGRAGASLFDALGSARSHGCVRIANEHIRRLARDLPLGTPVTIGD
jgi:lipoprotein-anchoring transpeptidase ErfK/SrfK